MALAFGELVHDLAGLRRIGCSVNHSENVDAGFDLLRARRIDRIEIVFEAPRYPDVTIHATYLGEREIEAIFRLTAVRNMSMDEYMVPYATLGELHIRDIRKHWIEGCHYEGTDVDGASQWMCEMVAVSLDLPQS